MPPLFCGSREDRPAHHLRCGDAAGSAVGTAGSGTSGTTTRLQAGSTRRLAHHLVQDARVMSILAVARHDRVGRHRRYAWLLTRPGWRNMAGPDPAWCCW